MAVCGGLLLSVVPAASAAPAARIIVAAPARVDAGRAFPITLRIPPSFPVSGFELSVSARRAAADIGQAVPGLRDATPLAPTGGRSFTRVGFFSRRPSVTETGILAQILVTPRRDGITEIRLGHASLVDASGKLVRIRLSRRILRIRVGEGGRIRLAPRFGTVTSAGEAHEGLDLTGDGSLTIADQGAAVLAWESGPGNTRMCGVGAGTGDVNGDGCVDVADLAAIASKRSNPSVRQVSFGIPTATWIVNTTNDAPDATPGNGLCATAAGACSLRAAIDESNRRRGDDLITFAVPGSAPQTIQLTGPLTQVNSTSGALKIDGYTQPGARVNTDALASNARPGIVIRGTRTTSDDRGRDTAIQITSGGNVFRGLAFSNLGRALYFYGAGAVDNEVTGNWFGLDGGGKAVLASGIAAVYIDGAARNLVGSSAVSDRNIFSSFCDGVYLVNPGTDDNLIRGNVIGLAPNGSTRTPLRCNGIDLNGGPKRNVIGGLGAGERNVIGTTRYTGVEISHGWNLALSPRQDASLAYQVNANQIVGNYIGIRPDGSYDKDFRPGLEYKQPYSGDNGAGVNVIDVANDNVVADNAIAATLYGVHIIGFQTERNIVRGNRIGLTPSGGNAFGGYVGIDIRWHARNEIIEDNQIANTEKAGIWIEDSDNDGNRISRNGFQRIGTLGIDLAPLGVVNLNDAGDIDAGANQGLNYPVVTRFSTTEISGAAPARSIVEVFYAKDKGQGPGMTFITSVTATATGTFTVPLAVPRDSYLTTTATDSSGNTSEFSVTVQVK